MTLFNINDTPAQHNVTLGLPRDPIDLLHPLIYSDENLAHAHHAYAQLMSDLTPQPVNPQFSKEFLEQIEQHKWLKNTQTILYTDSLDSLLKTLQDNAEPSHESINPDSRPIIALDLETTGLNKACKLIQGQIKHYNTIVGVCLAYSNDVGYYLPVNHNGLDEVPNYNYQDIIAFLQELVDEFHIVYHNATFDQEVMALNGIRFANSSFSDTLLLGFLMGWKQDYKMLGLKGLSKAVLNRPMLEINEITGSSDIVRLQTLPAKNAYVYGCSDAMNTYGLFDHIINLKDSPYKVQHYMTGILHNAVSSTRSMFRVGLPVDYEKALKATKTLIRRMVMLENIYLATISDPSVSISSASQLGIYFYTRLKREYEKRFNQGKPITPADPHFASLTKRLSDSFSITVKIRPLKTGDKVVADCDKNVLAGIIKNIHTWDFVDPSIQKELRLICEILNEYRSLDNKASIFIALVRNCYNDDLSLCRAPINLKLVGADSGRYSNGGSKQGAWDRIQVSYNTKGASVSFIEGHGCNEFNAQGLSHESGHWTTLKKVKNFKQLNPKFKEVSNRLDKMVESRLYDYILKGKAE